MPNFLQAINSKFVPPSESQLAAAADFVARWAEAWSSPNPNGDLFRDLMHPGTQNKIPPMYEPTNRDGVIAHFSQVLQHLPDLRIEVERWAPSGDTVIIEWIASATVANQLLHWTGTDRMRLRAGRTYEALAHWDTRQLDQRMAAAVEAGKDRSARTD